MKVVLCILDGVGISDNAQLSIPFIQQRLQHSGVLLDASEESVGLIKGQMGNSEVGHMTIGSGRIVYQNLTKIHHAIANDTFPKINGEIFHVIGLLSNGGVHSHIDHILHILKQLNNKKVFLHIITDGRDTPPQSILNHIEQVKNHYIATICGRYYAMDRDNRLNRTNLAYQAIAHGQSDHFFDSNDIKKYIQMQYDIGITDEFFIPACNMNYAGITPQDTVIFCNFRSDRMRQLVSQIHNTVICNDIISMVDYFDGQYNKIQHIFSKENLNNTLGEVLAKNGKKQLRIAETEKYAHVTFFFNGGREKAFDGEDRILIPSAQVKTYDIQPEMSAYQIMKQLKNAILLKYYDFICVNFANADMVGHTGNFNAAKKACDVLNQCLNELSIYTTNNKYILLITSDHGNIETMIDSNTQPYTAHTLNKVPLICINNDINNIWSSSKLQLKGLKDIAKLILHMMNIVVPLEME